MNYALCSGLARTQFAFYQRADVARDVPDIEGFPVDGMGARTQSHEGRGREFTHCHGALYLDTVFSGYRSTRVTLIDRRALPQAERVSRAAAVAGAAIAVAIAAITITVLAIAVLPVGYSGCCRWNRTGRTVLNDFL